MNVFEASDDLVEEEPEMFLAEILLTLEYFMQVRIHELEDNVNIFKLLSRKGCKDSLYLDDILVFEQS